jgi:MFS superfamily sulfate permease-like transporter
MFRSVPGLQVVSSYRRRWLLKDVIAGVVLTTLLVPQGMAYGDAKRAIALASMLAIMVAVIMIVAAVAKLGFIADQAANGPAPDQIGRAR